MLLRETTYAHEYINAVSRPVLQDGAMWVSQLCAVTQYRLLGERCCSARTVAMVENAGTPLHLAVRAGGNPGVVQQLVRARAQLDLRNDAGETVLEAAKHAGGWALQFLTDVVVDEDISC